MLITTKSIKGGVAKTCLSFALAKELDLFYITNDKENSSVSKFYNKTITSFNDEFVKENNIVFDAGGFIDEKMKDILKISDIIIIPYLLDLNTINSNNKLLNTLKENGSLDNIIVVISRVKNSDTNKKKLETLKKYLKLKWGFEENIFVMREIDIFSDIMDERLGLRDFLARKRLRIFCYKKFIEQDWEPFENFVKQKIKEVKLKNVEGKKEILSKEIIFESNSIQSEIIDEYVTKLEVNKEDKNEVSQEIENEVNEVFNNKFKEDDNSSQSLVNKVEEDLKRKQKEINVFSNPSLETQITEENILDKFHEHTSS